MVEHLLQTGCYTPRGFVWSSPHHNMMSGFQHNSLSLYVAINFFSLTLTSNREGFEDQAGRFMFAVNCSYSSLPTDTYFYNHCKSLLATVCRFKPYKTKAAPLSGRHHIPKQDHPNLTWQNSSLAACWRLVENFYFTQILTSQPSLCTPATYLKGPKSSEVAIHQLWQLQVQPRFFQVPRCTCGGWGKGAAVGPNGSHPTEWCSCCDVQLAMMVWT